MVQWRASLQAASSTSYPQNDNNPTELLGNTTLIKQADPTIIVQNWLFFVEITLNQVDFKYLIRP